ncbi:MAG: hypothetical protein A2381_18915 [Bdellovibrionales bacterium RIFOXYB1_FULL_37_110]|nr:MAG: hypothetical protein A2181_05225 [Bdellovibrionales bacterium RIFOXYA1_FULL_38_20]OFZ46577.1 MAG: hypothetical protein A2417_13920 [Bdellovibrionales bacterium RIFOXYC1_FULL_37_79]OFZ57699.1 MAG: hypothetical protein A2381_18915 [Bdellovibrionales bacterium RIFOXYB1_FULL_37_110]OFZ62955.1 MAG: hypothetical protein A2577_11570 [Bdellovibrionales bacterium RIFOXYD1_FULL_36_51]OFZ67427.1 MAG: hypothetical protein A2328_08815 [Bdellovibrionales bacterium RIFOXYB2_FULL_36_6]
MLKILLFFLILILICACGKSREELIDETIEKANILLTAGNCDLAITILEGIGRQTKNFRYLRTLSSAYACKAGYSESVLFGDDLPNISATSVWGSLSSFTTSTKMTAPTSKSFTNLITAIEIILYAGGGIPSTTEPTVAERSEFIQGAELGDLHTQALYMLISALGMYVYHYGAADAGLKAGRSGGDDCFLDYDETITTTSTYATLALYINNLPADNACRGIVNSGHPDLTTVAANVSRLCDGVFLFNNFRVVLTEVLADLAASVDDLKVLESVKVVLDLQRLALIQAQAGSADVDTVLSRSVCVLENTADTKYIQTYFLYYFDFLFN